MPSLELSIPRTSTQDSPKPHTVYHIALRLPLRSYEVPKRYSDFLDLHTSLQTHAGVAPPVSPPPKTYFSSTLSNPALTEERRAALESYLLTILTTPDPRWRDSPAWRSFLQLPASWAGSSAGKSVSMNITTGPIVDPTIWLDSHREVKGLLHDARLQLSKREQADVAAEQHEASVAAKKSLVKVSALLTALDRGLRETKSDASSTSSSEKNGTMLEGELRRRKDLVASARKERDALESLANSLAANRSAIAQNGGGVGDEKRQLFGAAPGNGRRVLGGPAQETQQTRELDNQGVLMLQKKTMEDQETGLQRLLKTVGVQKRMAVAIGEEVDEQTKMLRDLGDDVDRVEKKQNVARKRADKIR